MQFNIHKFHSVQRAQELSVIIQAALTAVDPCQAVERAIHIHNNQFNIAETGPIDLPDRVIVVGAGKASIDMAKGLVRILGSRISGGVVITKKLGSDISALPLANIEVTEGDHPIPGAKSMRATQKLIDVLKKCTPEDLVICLISGGASALMTAPMEGVSLADLRNLTKTLLASGAEIGEINAVRKHLDQVKGGGLVRMANGARVISLIISDVVGDSLTVIASGPTVPDFTTFQDAWRVIEKYRLTKEIPARIIKILYDGRVGKIQETLKKDAPIFQRVTNRVVANNFIAADHAVQKAKELGYDAKVFNNSLTGEARKVGTILAERLKASCQNIQPSSKGLLQVGGGETTVTLTGKGIGGRNLEVALGAVRSLDGIPDIALVTLATDGEDGPTDAAGAIVTGNTFGAGVRLGIWPETYLENNDSYTYFEKLDALVKTGSTGTNVMDLMFLCAFQN